MYGYYSNLWRHPVKQHQTRIIIRPTRYVIYKTTERNSKSQTDNSPTHQTCSNVHELKELGLCKDGDTLWNVIYFMYFPGSSDLVLRSSRGENGHVVDKLDIFQE